MGTRRQEVCKPCLHEQYDVKYVLCVSSLQSNSSTNMYTVQLSDTLDKIGNISFQESSLPVIIPQEGEVIFATVIHDGSSDPGVAIIDLPRCTFREIVLPL